MKKELAQLHQEFVNEQRYSARRRESTLSGYEQSFIVFTNIMKDVTIDELNSKTMNEFFRRLETRVRIIGRGIKKSGVNKSTVATYRSKLNQFFIWLKQNGHTKENPFEGIKYPNVRYDDLKFLRSEQVEKILTATTINVNWASNYVQKRNIAVLLTLLLAGIRRGELIGLKVMDVNLEKREMTVRAETSKSGISRIIPIHPRLKAALKDYLVERQKRLYATPFFFTSSDGTGPFTVNGLKNMVDQITRRSGVKFHPHQFRHTFAVNLIKQGMDVSELKLLLGHKDIRMTAAYLRCMPSSVMRSDIDALDLDNLA